MKNSATLFVSTLFALFLILPTYCQLNTPRTSPQASVTQTIGITQVTIDYSRPKVNDRVIWGELVPFGMNDLGFGTSKAAPWRAGADENTTISFSDDVNIEGKPLRAGKYGFHIEVRADNTATIILTNENNNWGSFYYNPSDDALRAEIKTTEVPFTESLNYTFTDLQTDSAVALLSWEKKGFPFKISVDVTKTVLDQFRNNQKGQTGFNRTNWEQAAAYALNNNGDLDEALDWINTAMQGQFFSQRNFNNIAIKAQIMQKKGNSQEYSKLMDEAAGMANAQQLNALGYQMLNSKDYDRALKYFEMAIEQDPKNANAYDSLGDAYKTMGEKDKAIKYFKKALSMNPTPAVKASSEKHLKDLGVD